MPAIVLIGDSIRLGYQATVQTALAGSAEVWGPEANGGHSVNVLMHWHLWVLHRKPDLVHVNCGLHDLKSDHYGSRTNLVPVAHYAANVERILRLTREVAGARVIWATTTLVQDEAHNRMHAQWQDFLRFDDDVRRYNDVARSVCARLGVPVDDLDAAVRADPARFPMTEDGVHFLPAGSAALGALVASSIRAGLADG